MKIILILFLPFVSSQLDCPSCKDEHGVEKCHQHTCKNGEFCMIKGDHDNLPEGTCHHNDHYSKHCTLIGSCNDHDSPYCYCCTTPDCVKNVKDKHSTPVQVSTLLHCPDCKEANGADDCDFHTCNDDEYCEIKDGHNFLPDGTCHHLKDFYKRCPNGDCSDHHSLHCPCCKTPDCVNTAMGKQTPPVQVSVLASHHSLSCHQCTNATSLDQCNTVTCGNQEVCSLRVNGNAKLQSGCEPHRKCNHHGCADYTHDVIKSGFHCEQCCENENCIHSAFGAIMPKLTVTCPICNMAATPDACFQNMQQCQGSNEKYCKLTTNGHHFSSECVTSPDCIARLPRFGDGCEENGNDVDCVHCCSDSQCFDLAFRRYLGTCEDKDSTCDVHISCDDQDIARSQCPKTCNLCSGICEDKDSTCDVHISCLDEDIARSQCPKTCNRCSSNATSTSSTPAIETTSVHTVVTTETTTRTAVSTTAMPTSAATVSMKSMPTSATTVSTNPMPTSAITQISTTEAPCVDTHSLRCDSNPVFCMDPDISSQLCRKTCGHCSTSSTLSTVSVTMPMTTTTTTAGQCIDSHKFTCDQSFCADPDFSVTYCRKTCGHCGTNSSVSVTSSSTKSPVINVNPTTGPTVVKTTTQQAVTQSAKATTTVTQPPPTTTAQPTTAAATSGTTAGVTHQCHQCGDIDTTSFCSGLEVVLPPLKPCPPSKPFCVTDIFVGSDGTYETIRRCADRNRCVKDWWEGTSDRSTCVDADPTTLSIKQTCTYCCVQDGCNHDNVPAKDTFFKP